VGASYSYLDAGLFPGQRYWYRLEDVDARSVSTVHGPVTAVASPAEAGDGGGGEGTAERGGGSAGDGSSESPEEGPSPCPPWLLSSLVGVSAPVRCSSHGDPESVSLSVLGRTSRSVDLELRTGGFWTVTPSDAVWPSPEGPTVVQAFVQGFDTPMDPQALALPLRRALVDAMVGKQVRLVSVEALEERRFPGLRPSAVGSPDLAVTRDGTVRPVRRPLAPPAASSMDFPTPLARLSGTLFQGERKRAVLELSPLRYDAPSGDLVLATHVRVRLLFAGVEPGETETGPSGRRAAAGASGGVLVQLHTARRGLYGVRFEEVFPGRVRGLPVSVLRLQRDGQAVPFRVSPRAELSGPGSVLLGDATYDPRRFSAGTTLDSPLPALWGRTSWLWTALNPVLGAVNGEDEVPDVAVGRIPATTVEEAERLIGKLLAWEGSGQGLEGKALLVADNKDAAGDFEWNVADIRSSFLGGREAEVLKVGELGATGTRPAVQAAFDGGLGLASYVGHGGSAVWASENVWTSWDAASLRAESRQPLLLTLNCLNGYFVGTNFESLAESLVKAEGRGGDRGGEPERSERRRAGPPVPPGAHGGAHERAPRAAGRRGPRRAGSVRGDGADAGAAVGTTCSAIRG
jgi:hypothetical protein